MRNVNIRNVNIRNVKFRGQRQTAKICSEDFKVSRLQIWGYKVTWEISTFEMLAFEISSVDEVTSNMGNINIWNVSIRNIKCRMQWQTAKIWGEGFNVTLRSKLCYITLIYVISIMPNLWQLTAHWNSWIVLPILWRSMIGLILIDW